VGIFVTLFHLFLERMAKALLLFLLDDEKKKQVAIQFFE
jgi:hypothetical protein